MPIGTGTCVYVNPCLSIQAVANFMKSFLVTSSYTAVHRRNTTGWKQTKGKQQKHKQPGRGHVRAEVGMRQLLDICDCDRLFRADENARNTSQTAKPKIKHDAVAPDKLFLRLCSAWAIKHFYFTALLLTVAFSSAWSSCKRGIFQTSSTSSGTKA